MKSQKTIDDLVTHVYKVYKAKHYLHNGGSGCCEANVEKRYPRYPAHEIGKRYAHAKSAYDTLQHCKSCPAAAAVIAAEAEEEGREYAIYAVRLKVFRGHVYYLWIV